MNGKLSALPRETFAVQAGKPLDEKTQRIALEELRETPERREEALVALRKLIHDEEKFHFRDDDDFLLIFLRPTKFYPESAFALIKKLCEFRANNGSVLDGLEPSSEEGSFKEGVVNVLIDRDQLGRRIMVCNLGACWEPKRINVDQIFRLFYLIHQMAVLEPQSQVSGVVVILDFDGMGMKQVGAFSIAFSRRLLSFIQDAMPLRLKNIHIVKQPYVFNIVFNMFKPFIREKLKSRMFFHGKDMPSLHKFISPECLPEDYGGSRPKIAYSGADWYETIKSEVDYIKQWHNFGYTKE
ncbi:retinaldehyde-binding protein 1 [Ischnura elegans]|uniref:retinaldehyde-binding protein 1 n=1 Tax=Ischnura elegans TaxID=197161 RepID=UPI001ED8B984|nr:retinaldehyde-binding protein 1 [Ischnura elegans]